MTCRRTFVLWLWSLATLSAQQPVRDAAVTWPSGSARISGVVATDGAGASPVARAIVTLSGGGLPRNRSAIADDAGRFTFDGLPGGRFSLSAAKPAYVTSAYGAKRVGRPGTPLMLAAGEAVNLTIVLARGAVITGSVHYKNGEPAANVAVSIMRADRADAGIGSPRYPATVMANDRGEYRFYGLAPGPYFIATLRPSGAGETGMMTAADIDAALHDLQQRQGIARIGAPQPAPNTTDSRRAPTYGYAPVFYPGTPIVGQATPIVVGAGEERAGVEFTTDLVPSVAIDGVITNPAGPLASVSLVITPDSDLLPLLLGATPSLAARPGADGKFHYTNVPPGRYRIVARSSVAAPVRGGGAAQGISVGQIQPAADSSAEVLWAMADVTVVNDDVVGVSLALAPAMRMTGRIAFEPGQTAPPAALTGIRVSLTSTSARGSASMNGTIMGDTIVPPAQVQRDGTFEFSGILPGTYRMSSTVPGWWLRSAIVNGVDVLDVPLEIGSAGNLSSAALTFSDRHTELTGTIRTAAGQPASEYFIVAIPSDRALWRPKSRRMQATRPASDGTFALRDLPPGDYLLATLTDVEPSDLDDPLFLEQMAAGAMKLTLTDGEHKTQDLRIAGGTP